MRCTSAIRQMAYLAIPNSLDEYLQMGATTARDSLRIFCKEKHGFPGMLESIDCRNWSWGNYPVAFKAQFSRGDHGPYPFILLEAIASNDLWIWHAFFGVSGMNNDVNVLRQSPLFNDLKPGTILFRDLLPDVKNAYATISSEESHRVVISGSGTSQSSSDERLSTFLNLLKDNYGQSKNVHANMAAHTKTAAHGHDLEASTYALSLASEIMRFSANLVETHRRI
ncbi:ALP1-like protein [Tanacetum coccineum]